VNTGKTYDDITSSEEHGQKGNAVTIGWSVNIFALMGR